MVGEAKGQAFRQKMYKNSAGQRPALFLYLMCILIYLNPRPYTLVPAVLPTNLLPLILVHVWILVGVVALVVVILLLVSSVLVLVS
mgnify:CR=1 FL=1